MRIIVRAVRTRMECVSYLQRHLPEAEIFFDSTGNAMDTFLAAMVMAGMRAVFIWKTTYILP